MLTTTSFLVAIAFLLLYSTSAKVKHGPSKIERMLKSNAVAGRSVSWALFVSALVISIFSFGAGTGSLLFFVILMATGGLVILLMPLRILNIPALLAIFAVMLLIESLVI